MKKWWNPATWVSTQPKASYGGTLEDEARLIDAFIGVSAGYPTASGVVVNESTAMRVSAVYRCVALLSGTIASLPCEVYRNAKGGKAESATDHPAYYLLHNEACALMTAHQFWRTFLWSAFMHGNGYALVGRTSLGAPKSLSWVAPHRCTPKLSDDKTRLLSQMTLPAGQYAVFDQDDVLHWTFLGWDGTKGMSPMDCARGAIALAVAGQEFNERFFSQGNAANLAFEIPNQMDEAQAELFYKLWEKNHTGMSKTHLPIIAQNGAKVTRLDFKADESQLMESRSFQVEDICRFYGVPPHMVGHTSKSTSWGTGIEEQTLGFVKFTLRDILKGLEQEIDRKLLRSAKFYSKFNLDALLRADSKGRADFYKAALGGTQNPGFMTVNEVRALENLAPLDGGDELHAPEPAAQPDTTNQPDQTTNGGSNAA